MPQGKGQTGTPRCAGGRGRGMGGGGRGMGGGGMGGGGRGMGGQPDAVPSSTRSVQQQRSATQTGIRKLAITSEGPAMTDRVDPRFGRAAGFVVVDLETMETTYVDNGASQVLAQGAGIQAAETLANAGVQAVLTGYVGPKAFAALSAAGIRIGQDVENVSVGQAVELYTSGAVSFADTPNSQSGVNK